MKKVTEFLKRYVHAALSCFYLFTVGFLFAKNRLLINRICNHFGYKPVKAIIPKVKISEIIHDNIPIIVREPTVEDGNITLLELTSINSFIKDMNPDKVFELGTFDGRTTLNMASNCEDDVTIYTLDLPKDKLSSTALPIGHDDIGYIDKDVSGSMYIGTYEEKKIVQLYGDTATFDFSPYFNTIDLVFVDAAHSYEYTLNDSKLALKLLKNGKGTIFWHDYDGKEGVTRALNEVYSTIPEFKNVKHIIGTSLACLVVK